ncbi:hypothetical protein [Deinococcus sp.]|uniref:hypothetical protein n=1 Tax=Deinococcus sp. TaxID=47478 RepID=UPI0028699CF4|nr:hypothetical protein [Deinococcus sp.]
MPEHPTIRVTCIHCYDEPWYDDPRHDGPADRATLPEAQAWILAFRIGDHPANADGVPDAPEHAVPHADHSDSGSVAIPA